MTFPLFPLFRCSRGVGVSENKSQCTIAAAPYLRALGARWTMSTPDGGGRTGGNIAATLRVAMTSPSRPMPSRRLTS
jgi:hypothetical protein